MSQIDFSRLEKNKQTIRGNVANFSEILMTLEN
jgi:hypothetical protein